MRKTYSKYIQVKILIHLPGIYPGRSISLIGLHPRGPEMDQNRFIVT